MSDMFDMGTSSVMVPSLTVVTAVLVAVIAAGGDSSEGVTIILLISLF